MTTTTTRLAPEEAGYRRVANAWVCDLELEPGRACNELFSCKRRKAFERHRLEVHHKSGPLPLLKSGPGATCSEEEKRRRHAELQARYVAKKGPIAMQQIRDAHRLKELVLMYGRGFDAIRAAGRQPQGAPSPVLPGVMTFIADAMSARPGTLDLPRASVYTMWESARHEPVMIAMLFAATSKASASTVSEETLRAYASHAGMGAELRDKWPEW